jgi:hypothetical protein
MSIGTIVVILLILWLAGVFGGHHLGGWDYRYSGGIGLGTVVVIVLILWLVGVIH